MEPHHAVRVLHFFRNPRHELGAILRVALGEKRERSARGPGTSNVGRDINVSALNEVIAVGSSLTYGLWVRRTGN